MTVYNYDPGAAALLLTALCEHVLPPDHSLGIAYPMMDGVDRTGAPVWVSPCYGWQPGLALDSVSTHFTLSVYRGVDPGAPLRRSMAHVVGSFGVLVDDVGTKGGGLPGDIEPFARIQTSPGNVQWVVAFDRMVPVADAEFICGILNTAKGWGDPSGNSPVRLGRLLGSLPPGKAHPATLQTLSGTRHHVLDVQTALLACMDPDHRQAWDARNGRGASGGALDPGLLLHHDPTFRWLRETGRITADRPSYKGFWDLTCPWEHDHRPEGQERAAGYKPGLRYEDRAFHCFRGGGHVTALAREAGLRSQTDLFHRWVRTRRGPGVITLPDPLGTKADILTTLRGHS